MDGYFVDRQDAGNQLAKKIISEFGRPNDAVVLGLPRGGVVVALNVAQKMGLPLDIIVTRKIGHPLNLEYAVAAVSTHEVVFGPNAGVDPAYILAQADKEKKEILRLAKLYRGGRPMIPVSGKTVFLVDDGIATGLTVKAAIFELRYLHPVAIIVATPVIAPTVLNELKIIADEVIALLTDEYLSAVGAYYQKFPQISDKEVVRTLTSFLVLQRRGRARRKTGAG